MDEHSDWQDDDAAAPGDAGARAGVKVIPRSGQEIPYPNCLLIDPYRTSPESPTLLATVEHFVEERQATGFPWKIRAIHDEVVTFKEAMDLALRYAEAKKIPIILVNQDGLSSEAEKRQTDTTVLDMSYHRRERERNG
jgi:hypothetical protein